MQRVTLVLVLLPVLGLLTSCMVAFRDTGGTALAPAAAGSGTARSIVVGDEGGLLTRLLLGGVGVAAAAGAVENPRTTTSVTRDGERIVVNETTTATVNPQTAASAGAITRAATSSESLSSSSGGLAASLEIASRKLGGDTSGWKLWFGGAFRFTRASAHFLRGWKGYLGLGYGEFTVHRSHEASPGGPAMDFDVTFLGLPLRLGYIIGVPKNPKAVLPIVGLEAFVKLDANIFSLTDDGQPSPWHAGARLNFYVLYVEAAASFPTFSVRDRGLAIEAGIGF